MKSNLFSSKKDNVYLVYDKISRYPITFLIANSDGEAVRKAMLSLRCPLKDSEVYHVGSFSPNVSVNFKTCKLRHVKWSCYKLPETISEALAPLEASPEELQEIVNSVAKKSEVIENE